MRLLLFLFILLSFTISAKNIAIDPDNLFPIVKLETSKGIVIVELDRIRAPLTVDNFLMYVVKGEYNNTIFHRVVSDFIVQGGVYDEHLNAKKIDVDFANESGNGLKNIIGTIAMAKENRPHTANRQFFFNTGDNKSLDPGRRWGYTVFGAIIEGQEVIDAINLVKTEYNDGMGWDDVPVEPITLIKATLLPAE
jgi:peptidyl-prolyl cis-trans isomerase A (cyclophilin A)